METLRFIPKALLSTRNKELYGVDGNIDMNVKTNRFDKYSFLNVQHEALYEALEPFGTWELLESEE